MDHPAFVARGHQIITECMARAKAAEMAHHKSVAVSTHVEACLRQLWAHMAQLAADLNPAAPPSPPFGVADPPSPRPIPEVAPVMGVSSAETFTPSRRDTKPRGIVPPDRCVTEAKLRETLLGSVARTRQFYEDAGCRFFLAQMQFAAYKGAVLRYQARYRLQEKALAGESYEHADRS